eukprot:5873409-Pyramimonas_sp.AAC.1
MTDPPLGWKMESIVLVSGRSGSSHIFRASAAHSRSRIVDVFKIFASAPQVAVVAQGYIAA